MPDTCVEDNSGMIGILSPGGNTEVGKQKLPCLDIRGKSSQVAEQEEAFT